MGMKGNNFLQQAIHVPLLKPTTLNSGGTATIDTAAISEPWRKGRRLVLGVRADVPAASGLTAKLIGKKRSDGAWEVVTDKAAAEVAFAAAKLADGTDGETKGLVGEFDLTQMKSDVYSDLGLRLANSAATDVVVMPYGFITDLYDVPSGQADEFSAVDLQ